MGIFLVAVIRIWQYILGFCSTLLRRGKQTVTGQSPLRRLLQHPFTQDTPYRFLCLLRSSKELGDLVVDIGAFPPTAATAARVAQAAGIDGQTGSSFTAMNTIEDSLTALSGLFQLKRDAYSMSCTSFDAMFPGHIALIRDSLEHFGLSCDDAEAFVQQKEISKGGITLIGTLGLNSMANLSDYLDGTKTGMLGPVALLAMNPDIQLDIPTRLAITAQLLGMLSAGKLDRLLLTKLSSDLTQPADTWARCLFWRIVQESEEQISQLLTSKLSKKGKRRRQDDDITWAVQVWRRRVDQWLDAGFNSDEPCTPITVEGGSEYPATSTLPPNQRGSLPRSIPYNLANFPFTSLLNALDTWSRHTEFHWRFGVYHLGSMLGNANGASNSLQWAPPPSRAGCLRASPPPAQNRQSACSKFSISDLRHAAQSPWHSSSHDSLPTFQPVRTPHSVRSMAIHEYDSDSRAQPSDTTPNSPRSRQASLPTLYPESTLLVDSPRGPKPSSPLSLIGVMRRMSVGSDLSQTAAPRGWAHSVLIQPTHGRTPSPLQGPRGPPPLEHLSEDDEKLATSLASQLGLPVRKVAAGLTKPKEERALNEFIELDTELENGLEILQRALDTVRGGDLTVSPRDTPDPAGTPMSPLAGFVDSVIDEDDERISALNRSSSSDLTLECGTRRFFGALEADSYSDTEDIEYDSSQLIQYAVGALANGSEGEQPAILGASMSFFPADRSSSSQSVTPRGPDASSSVSFERGTLASRSIAPTQSENDVSGLDYRSSPSPCPSLSVSALESTASIASPPLSPAYQPAAPEPQTQGTTPRQRPISFPHIALPAQLLTIPQESRSPSLLAVEERLSHEMSDSPPTSRRSHGSDQASARRRPAFRSALQFLTPTSRTRMPQPPQLQVPTGPTSQLAAPEDRLLLATVAAKARTNSMEISRVVPQTQTERSSTSQYPSAPPARSVSSVTCMHVVSPTGAEQDAKMSPADLAARVNGSASIGRTMSLSEVRLGSRRGQRPKQKSESRL